MASSPPMYTNAHSLILPSEEDNPYSTLIFRPVMARRTSSFSSESSLGSSSFSYIEDLPLFSPSTPLNFKGVPFSWEKIPGIPKQKDSKDKEYSGHLLPLPPAGNSNSSSKRWLIQDEISPKKYHSNRFQHDPFFAALVECSKDDRRDRGHNMWKGSSKITRSSSDRFGFINLYNSCKTSCDVSESLVYPPRNTMQSRRSS